MANIEQRLPENVPGDFYVDSSCIDCDTCSQLAPAIFRDHGEQCSVYRQPETDAETRLALMALVACPTGSIGASKKHNAHIGIDAFPSRQGQEAGAGRTIFHLPIISCHLSFRTISDLRAFTNGK